ncbi:hypothetical protein BH23VER1_BH23VER1_11030 [soil metagenome]
MAKTTRKQRRTQENGETSNETAPALVEVAREEVEVGAGGRRWRNRRLASPRAIALSGLVGGIIGASLALVAAAIIMMNWTTGEGDGEPVPLSPAGSPEEMEEGAGAPQRDEPEMVGPPRSAMEGAGSRWGEEIEGALAALRHRVWLTALADRSIGLGERVAFDLLKGELDRFEGRRDDGHAAALAEVMRVQLFYAAGSRMAGYTLPVADLVPSSDASQGEAGLKTGEIVGLLEHDDWKVRTRAAYLLGGREGPAVREALIRTALADPHLEVVRECLFSLEENTSFDARDQLDIAGLKEWLALQGGAGRLE